MKRVGIITMHKVYNYGSIFQTFSLQKTFQNLGYETEIIDYIFPNEFHRGKAVSKSNSSKHKSRLKKNFIKLMYSRSLLQQHRSINNFISKYLKLSPNKYFSPDEIINNPPQYDIYVSGSDQIWNPNHTFGDPSFFLNFAKNGLKISYASSFGNNEISRNFISSYCKYLTQYDALSVREKSGIELIKSISNKNSQLVLDPTLLLNKKSWNEISVRKRIVEEKYILCYFLNYTFDAFPYVEKLAQYYQNKTGYKIVRVCRPPVNIFNKKTKFKVNATPEEFLSLIRDAEIVLTTSFHGTAFSVNFNKPFLSIVKSRKHLDARIKDFLNTLGLENNLVELNQNFDSISFDQINYNVVNAKLDTLRLESINFLKRALENENNIM